MKMFLRLAMVPMLIGMSSHSVAATGWARDVEVVQLGTYQYTATHFVWFSAPIPGCATTMAFNHDNPGGKALLAVLTTALISKRKVDVQYDGCDIYEVYLK